MSEETKTEPAADTKAAETESTPADTAGAGAENSRRKTRVGLVVSDKMSKTIAVDVVRRVPHPRFKKIIKRSTRLHAHDENEEAVIGDKVLVVECRPISKQKCWRLVEILAH